MPKLNKVFVFVLGGATNRICFRPRGDPMVLPGSGAKSPGNKPDRVTVCLPASLRVNHWRHSRMPVTHQGQDQFLLRVGENGSLSCV